MFILCVIDVVDEASVGSYWKNSSVQLWQPPDILKKGLKF